MRRDGSFCAKSVRYNIFTNGAPYLATKWLFTSFNETAGQSIKIARV